MVYTRVSETVFVIITAAHNFVQFENVSGDIRANHSKTTHFYLGLNTNNYKLKFDVIDYDVYPKYFDSKSFYKGDDVVLAVVKVNKNDKNYRKHKL